MQILQNDITFIFGSESPNNVLFFTGKEWEQETGTYYFGARRYDPTIGQWLGRDALAQHYSPYLYGSNNPLVRIDPDGLADGYVFVAVKSGNTTKAYEKAVSIATNTWLMYKRAGLDVKLNTSSTSQDFTSALNDLDSKFIRAVTHGAEKDPQLHFDDGSFIDARTINNENTVPSVGATNTTQDIMFFGCYQGKFNSIWKQALPNFDATNSGLVNTIPSMNNMYNQSFSDISIYGSNNSMFSNNMTGSDLSVATELNLFSVGANY